MTYIWNSYTFAVKRKILVDSCEKLYFSISIFCYFIRPILDIDLIIWSYFAESDYSVLKSNHASESSAIYLHPIITTTTTSVLAPSGRVALLLTASRFLLNHWISCTIWPDFKVAPKVKGAAFQVGQQGVKYGGDLQQLWPNSDFRDNKMADVDRRETSAAGKNT